MESNGILEKLTPYEVSWFDPRTQEQFSKTVYGFFSLEVLNKKCRDSGALNFNFRVVES